MKALRFFAAVLFIGACLLCSGCLPHTELDKQAIVEGIGIDRAEEGFEVTVQYFSMEGAGGTTLVDNTKSNVMIVNGKGKSVYTALASAAAKCGKNFMYGITKIIVLGKDAAEPDLRSVLSFAEKYYENNPRLLLAAAEDKASDIMNVKFKEENVSAEQLEELLKNAENMGICGCNELFCILNSMKSPTACTALPVLRAAQTGNSATDDGKTVEIIGGKLYSGGKDAGNISLSAMSGIQLLRGETVKTSVLAEVEDKDVAVVLYDIDRKIKPSYEDGKLRFEVEIRASGRYTDNQLDDQQAIALSPEAEKSCAESAIKRIESAVETVINGAGCDPCGLNYAISSKSYSDWLKVAERYEELLKTAEFPVKCRIRINRFGLTD